MAEDTTYRACRNTNPTSSFAHLRQAEKADALIRLAMSEEVSATGLSRQQFCEVMSNFAGRTISVHMLNSWLAPNRERCFFPAAYIEAFCQAAHSEKLKLLILGERLRSLLEFGEKGAAVLARNRRIRACKEVCGVSLA